MENAEDRCSELFDLMYGKERAYKDSVTEINRSWEAKLKEKEEEASELREQLARLTEQYPEKQVPVRRKKKTEYSDQDIARIKAELRTAGMRKEEEE
jgi:biopolymer transport protein ExbD